MKFKFRQRAYVKSGFFEGHECLIVGARYERFLLFFKHVFYSVFIENIHIPEREIAEKHLEAIP